MYRSSTIADAQKVRPLVENDPVTWAARRQYEKDFDEDRYRLEWTWVATDGSAVIAAAFWWAPSGAAHPTVLDYVTVAPSVAEPTAIVGELVRAAHAHFAREGMPGLPEMDIHAPANWRSDEAAMAAVVWRERAARSAGLTQSTERLRLRWESSSPPPPPRRDRLTFTSDPDDAVFLDAFARVAQGSLDAETRRDLAAIGVEKQAKGDLAYYLALPGGRENWRLAHRGDQLVGLIVPSRSAYDASISYLGVVPEMRGHGYVDDLLAEMTSIHVAQGATRVTATTDTTNHPMAAAFARAGYQIVDARLVLTAPPAAAGSAQGLRVALPAKNQS